MLGRKLLIQRATSQWCDTMLDVMLYVARVCLAAVFWLLVMLKAVQVPSEMQALLQSGTPAVSAMMGWCAQPCDLRGNYSCLFQECLSMRHLNCYARMTVAWLKGPKISMPGQPSWLRASCFTNPGVLPLVHATPFREVEA